MPVLDYINQDSTLTFTPETRLVEVAILMGQLGNNIDLEQKSLIALGSGNWQTFNSYHVEMDAKKIITSSTYLHVVQETAKTDKFTPVDCIFIVDKMQLLGILTLADMKQLVASKINLSIIKIAEVMRKPIITLQPNFDINSTMQLMRQYSLYHLPMVNDMGQLLGIVTPESITTALQKELSNTSNQLQREIAQRCSLELALKKAKNKLEKPKITANKQTQLLQVSEDRYIRAINAGKIGIWEWNIQNNEIYINPYLSAMLGYQEQENYRYIDDWLQFIHPDDIESVKLAIKSYLEGLISKYEIEYRMQHKNGSYVWLFNRGTVICDAKGKPCLMSGINTDITAYKQVENQMKASLEEKEVLLQEIHHRVKNNFQIISSLLSLKARYINDQQASDILKDSQNRIMAIAMLHNNMSKKYNLSMIDFCDYINKLTTNLISSYGIERNIQIHLNVDQVLLKTDIAIHCGLIINELVSNAIIHAFSCRKEGNIYVSFCRLEQGKFTLNISDDGAGFPECIKLPQKQSLGLQIVWSLVEQLEGKITFNSNKLGSLFTIKFVMPNSGKNNESKNTGY